MAAVLACGDGAVLSHRSAAALWEIGVEKRGVIDVSVTRRAELKRPGLRAVGQFERDGRSLTSSDWFLRSFPS